MTAYLDYAATTPLHPAVRAVMLRYFDEAFGNAGSRTHAFGAEAKGAVEHARRQIAAPTQTDPSEVIFTSGATEANNLAILGLQAFGEQAGRRHLVTTAIEHKAVLEPLEALAARGFELTVVSVGPSGRADPEALLAAVRPDTLLVSMMQVNNETGVIQPVAEVASGLVGLETFFHVDAAQGFAKIGGLENPRIDLISASAHKLMGPKGVGALITRRRRFNRPPLAPLMYGGGQERGLRPGTLPVPLIAGFGEAVDVASADNGVWTRITRQRRDDLLAAFAPLNPQPIGDCAQAAPHIAMMAFPGVDSEALMMALRDLAAVSNGSACTSASYTPSHVLTAMGLDPALVAGAVRFSWGAGGPEPQWADMAAEISRFTAPVA
jgi:cysteine desulfurase